MSIKLKRCYVKIKLKKILNDIKRKIEINIYFPTKTRTINEIQAYKLSK